MRRVLVIAGLVVAGLSCQDSSASVPSDNPLDQRFKIVGEAAGGDTAGRTASCALDLIMELGSEARPAAGAVEFPGIMGGAVSRTVLEADSSGFGFFADVYWPDAVARFGTRDLVQLILGDTALVEGGRFWKEIAQLRGVSDGAGGASGTWTCAPFDIWENGYVDTILVVQGTWRTEPY
jgi:hypothetical protein